MAIEGPLHELALGDVLQLLDLSRKTGTLSVQRDGQDRPVRIFLEQGAVAGVSANGRTKRIGELLLLAGKVTEGQVREALARQKREPDRLLGALLAEAGVDAAEVCRQLRFQVEELVCDLVRWTEGYFRFEEGPPAGAQISLRVPTEALLMEAVRRMDEWAALGSGVPDAELVPSLLDEGVEGTVLELQPQEWEVLAVIDGDRTLRAIAREVGRGEFEVAKAVFSLVDAGVVEVGSRRRAATAVATPARAAGEEALRAGRMEMARGWWSAAVEALERAVQADPLLDDAYLDLGRAAIRAGRLDRAEEALRTYLRLTDGTTTRWSGAERAVAALSTLRQLLEEEP